jgi:PST family polysaccharide transporter
MSIGFIVTALRVVPQALMQRDLQFRRLAGMEGIASLSTATANVTLATLGFGKWTLALGPMVGSIVMMTMVVSTKPQSFRRPNLPEIGRPFHFSKQILATRFAWWGYSNADFFIISKVLGKTALGIYGVGWNLAGIAVEKITALVGRVTPAFFSAVQDDLADIRRYLLLLTEGLSLLTFPVCIGLALVADDLVRFVLEPKWHLATVPLQMLAILACVRSIDPLLQQALAAIDEAKMNLNNTVVTVCVLPFGLYAGLTFGEYLTGAPPGTEVAISGAINGVALAWLILGPILFSRLLLRGLARIQLPLGKYAAALWPAVSGCLLMSAVVITIDITQPSRRFGWFVVKIIAGALTYGATLLLLHRDRVLMAREIVKKLRRGSPAPPMPQPDGVPPVDQEDVDVRELTSS